MKDMDRLRNTSPQILAELYKKHGTFTGVYKELGMSGKAKCVQQLLEQTIETIEPGIKKQHAPKNNYSINDIRLAVSSSVCMSDVLRKLNLTTHGACATTIKRLMISHDIDFSHFDVKSAMKRNKHRWNNEDIFVLNSPLPRSTLNAQIVKRGILGNPVCSECGIFNRYNNKPLSLTIDHINGIHNDNRIENLRWLCPNCHSQTENYCGKGSNLNTKSIGNSMVE